MKKTALFMLLVSFVLVSCNANGQGEQVNKKETIKESNTNLKTKSKMKTIHLTKAEFLKKVANYETNPNEWKYLGDKPAIVDFYASWCGPCKTIAPILEELAAEYGNELYIYKINTETEPELATAWRACDARIAGTSGTRRSARTAAAARHAAWRRRSPPARSRPTGPCRAGA